MLGLDTRLDTIRDIGPRFLTHLKNLKLETVRDLLWHFPFRYEDFSQIYRIGDLEPGQQATIQGEVVDVEVRRAWRKQLTIVEAQIRDETGEIRAVWFNQPYIKNILRPGRFANFSGKVAISESDHDIYLSHPTYELAGREEETKHTARLVPVYPETRGLTSKGLRFLVQPVLQNIAKIPEWLPESVLERERLPDVNEALQTIHFPATLDETIAAKQRFAFEDLFLLQLANLIRKQTIAAKRAPEIPADVEYVKSIIEKLPFALTHSQKQALWEILQDAARHRPMNRLLQGDVGSGKTVVAAIAALVAARAGYQTAILAPTEVLANQHYATFKKLFRHIAESEQPSVALMSGTDARLLAADDLESPVTKSKLKKIVSNGGVRVIIGTHALIQASVTFKNLGLVIIDEQHRFGVEQRAKLLKGSGGTLTPHFLSMSATPIPRTLMMTIFGDLDISAITELPSGRKPIATRIIAPEKRTEAYDFIRAEIKKGRQAFVICPRIDPEKPDEKGKQRNSGNVWRDAALLDLKSVTEEYEKLSKTIFPDLRLAMLHGKLKPKEKEKIMDNFRNGKTDVLVSTSVIEVGVDVPNATIMMIEGADRFGLAQLYQFRGRVGRGEHESFCFLFSDAKGETAKDRLEAIIKAKNGFELAERDLEIRGPGEFLGQKQTGLPDIAMSSLQNTDLIAASRTAAIETLREDPRLAGYPLLRKKLAEFGKRIHLE